MRRMRRMLPCLCFVVLALLCASPCMSQEAGRGVRVSLSLAGGKTVFRAGEPIRLVLSFTSEVDGYQLNVTTTRPPSPVDEVLLSNEAGVTRWLEESSGRHMYAPDHMTVQKITAAPATIELTLNDWFRFDRPGRYAVRVRTGRVMPPAGAAAYGSPVRLTTNEVGFEVTPMSRAEEEQEVRRLSALLDAAKNWRDENAVSEELSYLSGEASTREKVRRFLSAQGRSGNYSSNLFYGLFIARDRALVVRLLEAALRDPNTPATSQPLHALTRLRLLQEGIEPPPTAYSLVNTQEAGPAQRRSNEILDEYLRELAASLPKRAGLSRTTTAMTILTNVPKERPQSAQLLSGAREVLLQEFENLHAFDQEYLLRVYWEQFRDASLQPALERMLTKERQPQAYLIRASALKRLMELDPNRARPFVVAPLVEQALAELGPGQDSSFLLDLTRVKYPEAVGALVRRRLESDDPQVLSAAAYVMSQRGPAEDRRLIEARLERWQKEWGGRGAELDAAGNDTKAVVQAMVQVNLIDSLLMAKSWKLPEDRAGQLKQSCVTQVCRQHFRLR